MRKLSGLLLIAFCIIFTACDLLNAKVDPHFFDKIDEEIAWANAKKVSVTVIFPPGWGVSPQRGTGRVGDTRAGHSYSYGIEFNPNQDYAFIRWQAFRTSDLPYESAEHFEALLTWLNNEENRNRYRLDLIGTVILPDKLDENGGAGRFSISSDIDTTDITLVPYARAMPRINFSVPERNATYAPRRNSISVAFFSSLHPDTVKLEAGYFEVISQSITMDEHGNISYGPEESISKPDVEIHHIDPWTVMFTPDEDKGLPADSKITLRIGTLVRTGIGTSPYEPIELSWQTRSSIYIHSWKAEYNNGQININWTQESDAIPARIRHSVNGGTIRTLTTSLSPYATSYSFSDPGSSKFDKHEIWVDLSAVGGDLSEARDTITIWNVNGMTNSPATHFITNRDELEAIPLGSRDTVAILLNDITISGTSWTPRGGTSSATTFQGAFHGMGNTITISAALNWGSSTVGLFARTTYARINDINVVYSGDKTITKTSTGNINIGGLTGSSAESRFTNCTVSYAGSNILNIITTTQPETNSAFYIGGFVGATTGYNEFTNCSFKGNITLDIGSGANSFLYFGGFAGSMTGSTVSDCEFGGSLSVISVANVQSAYHYWIGGFAGMANGSPLTNISASGTLTHTFTNYNYGSTLHLGGLIGYAVGNGNISGSSSAVNLTLNNTSLSGTQKPMNVGGLVGNLGINNTSSLNTSRASDNITINNLVNSNVDLRAGALVGNYVTGLASRNYATGNVNITSGSSNSVYLDIHAGGLYGMLASGRSVSESWAKGDVTVTASSANRVYAGGLIGTNHGTVQDCFALGNVSLESNVLGGNQYAGGLVGYTPSSGTINRSFAAPEHVKIRTASAGANAYGGGIAGTASGLSNSVALAQSVTVTSNNNSRYARRIAGQTYSGTRSNNHAFTDMMVGVTSHNDDPNPSGSTVPGGTHSDYQGQGATIATLQTDTFWRNVFSGNSSVWDFSGISASRPYPLLANTPEILP